MADHQYLSIGEVLGLLLEDFPDVTISKIRFLESQGLIEPERTPSGYRKFYDNDVELLRAILHEQKANFLPLKVIRDRIESGAIESDTPSGRTPPRGISNVEQRGQKDRQPREPERSRDSVFRRTDGGPEWAGGRALIPGQPEAAILDIDATGGESRAPVTAAVPIVPTAPTTTPAPADRSDTQPTEATKKPAPATVISDQKPQSKPPRPAKPTAASIAPATSIEPRQEREAGSAAPPVAQPPQTARSPAEPAAAVTPAGGPPSRPAVGPATAAQPSMAPPISISSQASEPDARELPYNLEELCEAASITAVQLAELLDYGIVSSRGSAADTSFQPGAVAIARVAGQLLAQGIDARHLRAWRQAAERESALFEQRIMPLLRQRNPQARQAALNSLSELSGLGSQLHTALVDSLLQHHFDGT